MNSIASAMEPIPAILWGDRAIATLGARVVCEDYMLVVDDVDYDDAVGRLRSAGFQDCDWSCGSVAPDFYQGHIKERIYRRIVRDYGYLDQNSTGFFFPREQQPQTLFDRRPKIVLLRSSYAHIRTSDKKCTCGNNIQYPDAPQLLLSFIQTYLPTTQRAPIWASTPSATTMNVLVYTGPEVAQASFSSALAHLRSILQPHYTVQSITQQALSFQPWTTACALLVLPQCHSPFRSKSISAIQAFVENGGAFLGLSTGAIFSSNGLDPEVTRYLYPTYTPGGDSGLPPKNHTILLEDGSMVNVPKMLKNSFKNVVQLEGMASILATYEGGECAALLYGLGKGRVALWGPVDAAPLDSTLLPEHLLSFLLSKLQLQVPSPQEITHPHPQFLMGIPSSAGVAQSILESLSIPYPPSSPVKLEDVNDSFLFHPDASIGATIQEALTAFKDVNDSAGWQPKHVIVCADGTLPSKEDTPLFDCSAFFAALMDARKKDQIVPSRQ
ncbi:hypothetical protein ONZ45_g13598 [Pleurotus djamor]|nr:hypothetical protein ONZ45_g13598 [Pleurotus djamor]